MRDRGAGVSRAVRYGTKKRLGRNIKILVRVEWKVGDEIMTLPVYEALKKKYPRSFIRAQVSHPELLQANPFVDAVNPRGSFNADHVIDLKREVRSQPRHEFLRRIAGVDSWSEPKIYLENKEIDQAKNKWSLTGNALRVAISSPSRWFAKKWGRDKWIQLAEYFIRRHAARVFVLGKDDEPLPVGVNLIGLTSLREAACVLSRCHLFVGSDSGLVHLALAVGTPTAGLFGPVNPACLIADRADFFPVWSPVECRGCWSEDRMTYPDHCPKVAPDCMSSIPLAWVTEACEKLLARRRFESVTVP